ncbi:hypothetical protein GS597_14820 [Synechococcales cyanobacterium C]|uniref:Uncharacterized protein n=1 Tax=Petrachloros mirabilis ULC683 TaxID=2781853 RepID=A0A8K2A892_9CYAN|nr:hypothetical protein [Petrachloros mirabilis]NCJ07759.1 hypothetical protein [Petrachloros mirabilis ULC683]
MKLSHLCFFGLLGLISVPILASTPAQACTPHPDYPEACNSPLGFPLRKTPVGPIKPIPDPVCLSCPPHSLQLDKQIQPRVQNQRLQVQQINPSLGGLNGPAVDTHSGF